MRGRTGGVLAAALLLALALGAGSARAADGADGDIHPLRTDLRQDPSISAVSNGAHGVDAEAAVAYRVWHGLSVEAGVRYWRMDSGGGDVDFNSVTGTSRLKVNDAMMERYGPFVALNYRV